MITFDRVGICLNKARMAVEGYSPRNGRAHGSLTVDVLVCSECHQAVRDSIEACGMTPYTTQSQALDRLCGERTTFEANSYSNTHPEEAS